MTKKKTISKVVKTVDPAVRKFHLDRLKEDASPVSKAQFRVLKILYNRYGPRDWYGVNYLVIYQNVQGKTLDALAEKKLIKNFYSRTVTKENPEGVFQLKKVMITELGRQVVSYMNVFEEFKASLQKIGGVQKLK